mmetsp:Transcript_23535/g.31567  ORF Transcript_23535/g.31567 Transcript_23535/m.31567 type:complete len:229 (+) Transcript_23535:1096-1782(+)
MILSMEVTVRQAIAALAVEAAVVIMMRFRTPTSTASKIPSRAIRAGIDRECETNTMACFSALLMICSEDKKKGHWKQGRIQQPLTASFKPTAPEWAPPRTRSLHWMTKRRAPWTTCSTSKESQKWPLASSMRHKSPMEVAGLTANWQVRHFYTVRDEATQSWKLAGSIGLTSGTQWTITSGSRTSCTRSSMLALPPGMNSRCYSKTTERLLAILTFFGSIYSTMVDLS